jgi:hypothetical protein
MFADKGNLEKHVKAIHLQLRPYRCEVCEKTFAMKGGLKRHVDSVHLQLQSHQMREKTFTRSDRLKQSMDRVHEEIQPPKYMCEVCEMICTQPHYLKDYIDAVHLQPPQLMITNVRSIPHAEMYLF